MSGTTSACGPACDVLLAAKNGSQRHRFVLEIAIDNDRKRAFYAARYRAKNWDRAAFQLLSNIDLSASLACHQPVEDERRQAWKEEFRGLTRARARAKLVDYLDQENPDPGALTRLYLILTEGIDDRDSPGGPYSPCEGIALELPPGRAPAPKSQIRKAILRANRPVFTDWADLTPEQLVGLDTFKMSRHGDVEIRTTAPWASKLSASIEGLNSLTINEPQALAIARENWSRVRERLAAALEALAAGESQAWVRASSLELAESSRLSEPQRERFSELAESGVGGAGEVLVVLVGWGM